MISWRVSGEAELFFGDLSSSSSFISLSVWDSEARSQIQSQHPDIIELSCLLLLLMHFIRSKALFLVGFIAVSSVFQGPSFALKMTTANPSSWNNPHQQPTARPLNTDPYLNIVHYQTKGTNLKLKDHTEFYASGTTQSKHGVIIIPDTWGWNTGRIRNICDFFGDQNTFAVVPNFSSKGIEGERKRIFLNCNLPLMCRHYSLDQSYMESAGLADWYKSRTFDGETVSHCCYLLSL